MSNDPFQELFDREFPRSAKPSATRAELDSMTPKFQRARSRQRARLGAMAAVALLGTTGGAAALGAANPIGGNTSTDFTRLADATSVENFPEELHSIDEATVLIQPSDPTETSEDSAGPGDEEPVLPVDGADDSSDTNEPSEPTSTDDHDESDDDHSDDESDDHESDDDDHSDDESDDDSSDPAAGPLTASSDDGSVTVDVDGDTLVIVEVVPESGVGYTVSTDPDKPGEIEVDFFDIDSGEELSEIDFKLVDGGITYDVESLFD